MQAIGKMENAIHEAYDFDCPIPPHGPAMKSLDSITELTTYDSTLGSSSELPRALKVYPSGNSPVSKKTLASTGTTPEGLAASLRLPAIFVLSSVRLHSWRLALAFHLRLKRMSSPLSWLARRSPAFRFLSLLPPMHQLGPLSPSSSQLEVKFQFTRRPAPAPAPSTKPATIRPHNPRVVSGYAWVNRYLCSTVVATAFGQDRIDVTIESRLQITSPRFTPIMKSSSDRN